MSVSGRCGQDTSLYGCLRVTSVPTDWAAKGAEAHQHSEWTIQKIGGVRSLARTVQRRVATVTLHMAEQ